MNFTHEFSTSPNSVENITFYLSLSTYIYLFSYSSNAILGLPINSYVLWLICTGTRNGIVTEVFNLNLTVCDIFFCLFSLLFAVAYENEGVVYTISFSVSLPCVGRPLINCVICIERYLAVLHPVTFLKYKPLRYRLVCSAVIWVIVLGFGVFCLFFLSVGNMYMFICLYLPLYLVLLLIKLFCCLTIVRALKYPGPGEKGRKREEANNMKKKAIVVILIITVTMFAQYAPMIFIGLIYSTLSKADVFMGIGVAVFLMFGYVSPFLYIFRVRNL